VFSSAARPATQSGLGTRAANQDIEHWRVQCVPSKKAGLHMINLDKWSGIDLMRKVAELPRFPDDLGEKDALELLRQEAAVLDFVKTYAHVVNSADIDAVVDHYGDNAVWMNPRGRYVGTEEIRENYRHYYSPVRWFNFWTNISARFVRNIDEAYVSAYQYSLGVARGDPLRLGVVSTDVWHMKRLESSWKIMERRVDLLGDRGHRLLPSAET
jgi:ketosteroid isomerase-like protein